MYLAHWGLSSEPFSGHRDPAVFVATPTHVEALARLHFLADHRRALGLLAGPAGSGKTLINELFGRRLRAAGALVAVVSLRGLDDTELLAEVATGLGLNPDPADSPRRLWRSVAERMVACRFERRGCLLLLDDADGCYASGRRVVERLLDLDIAPDARQMVILSGQEIELRSFGRELLERAELRIDLHPLAEADAAQYISERLRRVGGDRQTFEPAAAAALWHLSSGLPRRINQLAELCLIAGAAADVRTVDEALVRNVFEGMRPFVPPSESYEHQAANDEAWTSEIGAACD